MEDEIFELVSIPGELSDITKEKLSKEITFTEGVNAVEPLTLLERTVCELTAERKGRQEIANYLGVPLSTVRCILAKPHIKSFIQDIVIAQYELTKEYRLSLLNKVIEAKIGNIEDELDGDFSKATKKDIIDLLIIQDNMLKEREKKELGTSDDTYITLLQQVIKQ
jgi:hypothetical protein